MFLHARTLAIENKMCEDLFATLSSDLDALHKAVESIEKAIAKKPAGGEKHIAHIRDSLVPAMAKARELSDRLEQNVPADIWPLPTYAEMLFIK